MARFISRKKTGLHSRLTGKESLFVIAFEYPLGKASERRNAARRVISVSFRLSTLVCKGSAKNHWSAVHTVVMRQKENLFQLSFPPTQVTSLHHMCSTRCTSFDRAKSNFNAKFTGYTTSFYNCCEKSHFNQYAQMHINNLIINKYNV